MSAHTTLHLLIIEDSADDAFIILHTLREAGFMVDHQRVESEQELRQALRDHAWDMIFSDYNMPGFDGLSALTVVREWTSEVPFIFISGMVDDDVGIRAMEGGANDYLLKDNLSRLIPVVRRELTEARIRQHGRFATLQHENILRTAHEAIISVDQSAHILLFNHGAEKIFGYQTAEILGRPLACLLPEGMAARHRYYLQMFSHERVNARPMGKGNHELKARHKDGHDFPVEVSISHTNLNGEVTYTAILRDITERKALEEANRRHTEELEEKVAQRTLELDKARRVAEELAQAKSDFLANMSHEIRTPMNAVLGLAYVLSKMPLPEDAADLARKIHKSGETLLGILNDVLDFSKIEANRMEIERSAFRLDDVLDNLTTLMSRTANEKSLELQINPPPAGANDLIGDPLRLGQVLINLTSNAIKFTQSGRVSIIIERVHTTVDRVTLRFSVQDTGIGMDPQTLERLFTPFTQADVSTTRRFGGSGLGLTICRRLIDLMGGNIEVQSQPGLGSTFSFTLSFSKAAAHARAPQTARTTVLQHRLQGLHLLVVDDSEINREVAKHIFQQEGATLTLASHGQEAIDWLSTHPGSLDAVLMDLHMPDIDGFETSRRLRQLPAAEALPIVALTAGSLSEYRQQLQEGGFNGMISKPFAVDSAIQTLLAAVQRTPWQPAAQECAAEGSPYAVMDSEYGLSVFQQAAIYARCLHTFRNQYQALIEPIPPVDVDQEFAHKLRGAAGSLGLRQVEACAKQLEWQLQREPDAPLSLEPLGEALRHAFQAITQFGTNPSLIAVPGDQQVFTPEQYHALFREIARGLSTLNPAAVEPALAQLGRATPAMAIHPLQTALDAFDFDAAGQALQQLATDLNVMLEVDHAPRTDTGY